MLIGVLAKTEGSPDSYGDPTTTWTLYEIVATTIHPYREEPLRYRDYGTFRGTMYSVTFNRDAKNLEHVIEGNRLYFNDQQYEIILQEDWIDSLGNVVRVYTLIEKCTDTVTYS